MTDATSPVPKDATPRGGPLRRWFGGIVRQQKSMAFSSRHRQLIDESIDSVKKLRDLKVAPTRVEAFEDAVTRKGLTPQMLSEQARSLKNEHLCLYFVGGLLAVYAIYLGMNFGVLQGFGAFVAACGALVNGYLRGFRAWQIENRSLIRLQDALRVPGTYLVL